MCGQLFILALRLLHTIKMNEIQKLMEDKARQVNPEFMLFLSTQRAKTEGQMGEALKKCYEDSVQLYNRLPDREREAFSNIVVPYLDDMKAKHDAMKEKQKRTEEDIKNQKDALKNTTGSR